MNLVLKPNLSLSGKISAPASKSYSIRAVFIASLGKKSTIKNLSLCDDVEASINVCRQLGAKIKFLNKSSCMISGVEGKIKFPKTFNVKESGTTLRFLLSIASLTKNNTKILGSGTLNSRPNKPLIDVLKKQGAKISGTGKNHCTPINVKKGSLKGGRIVIDGRLSSQFISSLLILGPFLSKDSIVKIKGSCLVSNPYIDMTILSLKKAGIHVKKSNSREFKVRGNQKYKALKNFNIPGDYGLGAFFMVASAINNCKIYFNNLKKDDFVQADMKILPMLKSMGVKYKISKSGLTILKSSKIKGAKLFCRDCPDLVPILSVLALFANSKTEIYGIEHTRTKESNRISDLRVELEKVGARIKETRGSLIIYPNCKLITGKTLNPHNDHRLAMAFCILGLKIGVTVSNIKCINKSYPDFLMDLSKLGAEFNQA